MSKFYNPRSTAPTLSKPLINYITHISSGISIRELARQQGSHPSMVLRQIRKIETRRDDPLFDAALDQNFGQITKTQLHLHLENTHMTSQPILDESEIAHILRRLCENSSFLLVSPQMEMAAVFKETVSGRRTRMAVVEQKYVHAFSLKEWISGEQRGKIGRYTITSIGRTALQRMLAKDQEELSEGAEFQEQHKEFGERVVHIYDGSGRKSQQYNLAESPLTLPAEKRIRRGHVICRKICWSRVNGYERILSVLNLGRKWRRTGIGF
ncbi:MAG: hypothetical protein AAED33_04625 [Paracoccaceae bacterium]